MSKAQSPQRQTQQQRVEFSEEQSRFMNYTGKQGLLYGGFGGGKTRTGNEKGYLLGMKYPGNRGLIVRAKSSDVKGSTIEQSLLEEVIPDTHIPEDPSEGHNQTKRIIRHRTGVTTEFGEPVKSEIHYHGLDSTGSNSNDGLPRKISGMEFGWIFVDEATELNESDWVQLIGRLRYTGKTIGGKKYTVPFRQIFGATNPAGPNHWLHQKFFSDEAKESDDIDTFHLKAEDNPGVDDAYVSDMKSNYSGVYYERYVLGNWVGTSDAIYDDFDRREHVVDLKGLREINDGWKMSELDGIQKPVPPANWRVYRSIDFGFPSPMVVQWWARSPEKMWVMFREFYQSETLVEDAAEMIKKFSQDLEIEQTYADPAQASDRETLQRNGVSSGKAKKDVWNGIQEVKAAITDDRMYFYDDSLVHISDGDLEAGNKPVRTVDEIPGYEWKNSDDDKPRKKDDHGMDSMRYAVYSVEGSGGGFDEEYMEQMDEIFNEGGF